MIEGFVDYLSLDLKLVTMGIAIAIGATQALKKFGKIQGWANLIPVGGCSIAQGFLFGTPDPMSVLAYMFSIFGGAVMGWEVVKGVAHKVGTK